MLLNMYLPIPRVHLKKKKKSEKDLSNEAYAMFILFSQFFFIFRFFFFFFFRKSMCCMTSRCNSNRYQQHVPLQRSRQKVYLKTMDLFDCPLIGVCAVIRLTMVFFLVSI